MNKCPECGRELPCECYAGCQDKISQYGSSALQALILANDKKIGPFHTPLVDADGENRAVRWFLALYGCSGGTTINTMKQHLKRCGYPLWPDWCDTEHPGSHLTKGGAQLWIRYLFDLEKTDSVIKEGD